MKDGEEVKTYATNPNSVDSDNDSLTDGEEVKTHHTNPNSNDSDGDGLKDAEEITTYHTNPISDDSDADGLKDAEEIMIYHTNPNSDDSDNDGLKDAEEITTHHTNPNSDDSDGDGLKDGEEIGTYSTNPNDIDSDDDNLSDGDEVNTYYTNPNKIDTDGDCLPDNHEIINYETNATNPDTDKDGIEDGFEIYGDMTASCETRSVLNANPVQDNIPVDGDVIDALDPTNDSDGDGWVNVKELNCTGGDPSDATKICPSITSSPEGEALASYGYTFIPGAFDVDGDGVDEGGFWTSVYQATEEGSKILNKDVKTTIGDNFNAFVVDNFPLLNSDSEIDGFYKGEFPLNDDAELLTFEQNDILDASNVRKTTMPRYVGVSPYMAMVSIKHIIFRDTDSNELNVSINMLSNKQYTHIQMLLDKDKEVNGEGNDSYVPIIRNGLLGVDINVPISNYSIKLEEFDRSHLEFVSSTLHMYSEDGVVFNESTDIQPWWGIKEKEFPTKGTNSRDKLRDIDNDGTIEGVVSTVGGYYAVMVRGGDFLNLKEGIVGGNSDVDANTAIGFRAATDYLY